MPRKLSVQRAQEVRKAASLYRRFSGHQVDRVARVKVNKFPKTAVAIGTVVGIIYDTVRDGESQRYIHRFKRSARPLFAVSHDGKTLLMLGGAYDFTERGIVDRD